MNKRDAKLIARILAIFTVLWVLYSSRPSKPNPSRRSDNFQASDTRDQVYQETITELDIDAYRETLISFVRSAFPTSIQDSTINTLERLAQKPTLNSRIARASRTIDIPLNIYQTSQWVNPDTRKNWDIRSWIRKNPDWKYHHYNDDQMDEWIHSTFKHTGEKSADVVKAYEAMQLKVMRADFWRYLILAVQGGVYTDYDTRCLKPIRKWHRDPYDLYRQPESEPAIIVGIEADVGVRHDWHDWWPRPIQITQWTIKSIAGHPVLIDAVRRITNEVNSRNGTINVNRLRTSPAGRLVDTVLEITGPGVFTDSVMNYLMVKYNVNWRDLRNLTTAVRFDDIMILPITGFSPGVGHQGSQPIFHPTAFVHHLFTGSWKDTSHA